MFLRYKEKQGIILLYDIHLSFIGFLGLLSMKTAFQAVLSAHEYRITLL